MVKCVIYETLEKMNTLLGPIGFAITLIGLGFTYCQAVRAKTSADLAREETEKAVRSLAKYSVISDVSAAIKAIEEIRGYQRHKVWPPLLDRYSSLAIILNRIKADQRILDENDRARIQSTVTHARQVEKKIERALNRDEKPQNADKLNSVLAEKIDDISEILGRLEREYQE